MWIVHHADYQEWDFGFFEFLSSIWAGSKLVLVFTFVCIVEKKDIYIVFLYNKIVREIFLNSIKNMHANYFVSNKVIYLIIVRIMYIADAISVYFSKSRMELRDRGYKALEQVSGDEDRRKPETRCVLRARVVRNCR